MQSTTLIQPNNTLNTHRGHGHYMAHGARVATTDAERQTHLDKMMTELAGKETGYSRGCGGSMHIADTAHGLRFNSLSCKAFVIHS